MFVLSRTRMLKQQNDVGSITHLQIMGMFLTLLITSILIEMMKI